MEDLFSEARAIETNRSPDCPDGAPGQVKWFHYIKIERKAEWEAVGWRVIDEFQDLHHGRHGVLAQWEGGGEPVIP